MPLPARIAAALTVLALAAPPARASVDPADAHRVFAEAKAICDRDRGRFWGRSLCGPMLLIDPDDRTVISNTADPGGVLKPEGDVFAGVLPKDVIVSNTPVEWQGRRWTELMMPMAPKAASPGPYTITGESWRSVLIAHELFHRIQPEVGLARPDGGDAHLDTLEGRYLLQLEWRALARALQAPGARARRAAIADAVAFRRERYRLFPTAAAEEYNLDMAEGMAEYTGVRLGLATPAARTGYALRDLKAFVAMPTFVRSFAYASGPAYGLLLDEVDPRWRAKAAKGQHLDALMAAALHLPAMPPAELKRREAVYDADGALRAAEVARDRARLARLADLTHKLVDGPVLILPRVHSRYQFNPQTLVPLDQGMVYPTLRLLDDWGVLDVSHDALFDKTAGDARVSAMGVDPKAPKSADWTLELKPGWIVAPGPRPGDLVVKPAAP